MIYSIRSRFTLGAKAFVGINYILKVLRLWPLLAIVMIISGVPPGRGGISSKRLRRPAFLAFKDLSGADFMVPSDPESSSLEPAQAAITPQYSGEGSRFAVKPGRLLAFAVAAALIAGAATLVACEKILDAYNNDLFPPINFNPTVEEMSRLRAARLATATLTFTCLGGFLGLAMGLTGGLARRSVPAGIRAGIVGFVLGAVTEAFLAYLVVLMFFKRYDPLVGDLALPLLTHGAIWLAVGAISGLAFGLGLGGKGRWRSTLVGGLLGAAVATVVYEIGGALVFASSKTELPLSSTVTTQAIALLLVATFSAVGAAWASNSFVRAKDSASVPS